MSEENGFKKRKADFQYHKTVPPGIQIFYNELVFNDREAPINLWLLKNSQDIQGAKVFHAHEYIQICYVYKGSISHWLGNSKHIMAKGDIFVIPPMTPHLMENVGNNEPFVYELEFDPMFININLSGEYINSGIFDFAYIEPFLTFENNIKPRLNISGKVQVKIETMLQEIEDELLHKKDGYKQYIKANLLKILVLVGREYASSNISNTEGNNLLRKYKNAILNSIEYINKNYKQDLKLKEIYHYSMMSQTYFSNIFKHITKMTFTEYINDLRIKKAIELLKDDDKKISDICYDVGYNEVSHFNRIFKKYTCFSPSTYRKYFSGI